MSDSPADPLTELAKSAAAQHEIFTSYLDAGFTEQQAMQLVLGIITAGIMKLNPPETP